MRLKTLLSALTALLILPSLASAATTADFNPGPGETASAGTWTRTYTVTTAAAGNAVSKGEHIVELNVTSGTFGQMLYRTVKMHLNQTSYQYGSANALFFGLNTITVGAVTNEDFLADTTLGRSVKIQFSNDNIGFDSLTVNGVNANPDEVDGSPFLGRPLSTSENFNAGPDVTWQAVLPLTTVADGVASQGEQTAVINVTYIPQGGANYRVYQTTVSGGDYFAPPTALVLGENTITVSTATSDRAVDVQFSNDAVEFDALTVNGEDMLAGPISPAEGTQGTGEPISQYSDIFAAGSNADYPAVATLALTGEGAATLGEQTLVMNITYIPGSGASYRIYDTNEISGGTFSDAQALFVGVNTITVPAVTFDGDIQSRTVKAQFSGDDIEFDTLTINGENQLTITPAEGTQGVGDPISDFSNIITENYNGSYFVAAMTTPEADGAASQAEQTAVINVTYIPEGGASWRSNSTNAGGNYNAANEGSLALGPNTITVAAVAFDRTVNIQFSSDAIEFDALTFNGENPLVTTPGTGTQGIGQSISESAPIFVATTNATWVTVTTMTTTGSGAPSQGTQTLEMNVTYIPGSGAQMRSYNTNEISGGTFSGAQTLTLGINTITVPATVGWANPSQGRATKVQVSSDAIEFDALTFNGVNQVAPAVGTPDVGDPISDFSDIFTATGASAQADGWESLTTMTTAGSGAHGQDAQTLEIDVTYIPAGGAQMRGWSQGENGGGTFYDPQTLTLGINTIIVPATVGWANPSQGRATKIQFSSADVEFDTLTINGENQLTITPAEGTQGVGDPISDFSNIITENYNGSYFVAAMTTPEADGAASQAEQTAVINVTYIPEGGATWRSNSTVASGVYNAANEGTLALGENTFTVPAVDYDRFVKIQFSSNAIEFTTLTFNGVDAMPSSPNLTFTFTLNGNGTEYSVTDCLTSASGSLDIPSTYNGLPVTSIGDYVFNSRSSLTSITIPDSVTSIGEHVFQHCTNLNSIIIPDSLTSIGQYAFSNCSSLASITIPDSVTSIGNYAFNSCTSLTSITIPDSVTSIGNYAFQSCTSLTNITISDSVTSIGNYAFNSCTSLTSITIPDSVTSIGDWAFNNCSGLTSITISDSVTSIGSRVFRVCSGLTSITIPDSVTSIGDYAFQSCSNLVSVTFEGDAPTFGTDVFTYSNSVTIYYDPNYSGWSNNVAGRPAVQTNLLLLTLNETDMEYSLTDCLESASGSLDIPSTYNGLPVTSIGNGAFVNCTSLSSITIPDSVTSIGTNAFSNCTSLTSVTIPDSVTSIGVGTFSHCTNLSSITIPNSVTSIRDHAFSSCSSLSSITIPDSVTSIGGYAFSSCTSLTNITIPDSVTSIGNYAFYACSSLSSITIPGSMTSIGAGVFYSCTSLTSITIPDSVTSIGTSAFYSCTSLTSITIPDSVASIGRNAFGNIQASISFSRHLLEATEAERDARLTMDEVKDARVSSTMIEVSEGKADITMTLEETSDLNDWSNATTSEKTIEVDAPPGTRFYRFKMTE